MEYIRIARKKKGLTQEQLADAIGVKRSVISKYESGAISPSVEQLQHIATALDIPVTNLLIGPTDELKADLSPSEFNEFERFIESFGCYTRYDENAGKYQLHKGKRSVTITPDELKELVRNSTATVAALVQALIDTAADKK